MNEPTCWHANHCDCMLDECVRNDGANMMTVYCYVVRFPHCPLRPMNLFQSIQRVNLNTQNWFRCPVDHADSDEMSENDLILVVLMLVALIHPWAMDYALVQNYNTDAVAAVVVALVVLVVVVVVAAAAALAVVLPSEYGLNNWQRDVRVMNSLASPHSYDPNHLQQHYRGKRAHNSAERDSMDLMAMSCAILFRPVVRNIQTMMPAAVV